MTILRTIEHRLAADYRQYHVRAQITRVVAAAAVAVLWPLTSDGAGPLDLRALLPLAWGAASVAIRSQLRTALQKTAVEHLQDAQEEAATPSPRPSATPSPSAPPADPF